MADSRWATWHRAEEKRRVGGFFEDIWRGSTSFTETRSHGRRVNTIVMWRRHLLPFNFKQYSYSPECDIHIHTPLNGVTQGDAALTGSRHLTQRPAAHRGAWALEEILLSPTPAHREGAHIVGRIQKSVLKACWLSELKNKNTTPIIWFHIIPGTWQALSHNLTSHGHLSGKHWVTAWWRGSPKMSSVRWNPREITKEENKSILFL